ncbi:MAG: cytochrome c biogenesis protein ResB [Alistipes sp.]
MNTWQADLSLWQFPASLILGVVFALSVWALHLYHPQSRLCRLLSGIPMAVVGLVLVGLAMAVEGTWGQGIHLTYPFIVLLLLLMANLELTILRRLPQHNVGFLLNHAGLFLILWGGLFGAPDVTQARMVVPRGEAVRVAQTAQGALVPLPFEVRLDRFTIDCFDDGSPRQYRSELQIDGHACPIEVNAPAHTKGYTIYQESYDRAHNAYTVLLLVRDPWLWVVWLGMGLLAVGSCLFIFRRS